MNESRPAVRRLAFTRPFPARSPPGCYSPTRSPAGREGQLGMPGRRRNTIKQGGGGEAGCRAEAPPPPWPPPPPLSPRPLPPGSSSGPGERRRRPGTGGGGGGGGALLHQAGAHRHLDHLRLFRDLSQLGGGPPTATEVPRCWSIPTSPSIRRAPFRGGRSSRFLGLVARPGGALAPVSARSPAPPCLDATAPGHPGEGRGAKEEARALTRGGRVLRRAGRR